MLIHAALRVLSDYTEHRQPQPADVELLKKHALPSEADLPVDALACEIIKHELAARKSKSATATEANGNGPCSAPPSPECDNRTSSPH
jgi:hypothetical protein